MKEEKKYLVMYVPALHQSYVNFFEAYAPQVEGLYILGEDILAEFPILEREIRAIKPEVAKRFLENAGYFKKVEVLNKKGLAKLKHQKIVMSDEEIMEEIIAKYFSRQRVDQEKRFFLRFYEKMVKNAVGEAEYDCQISKKDFDRQIMSIAKNESKKSSDWFRQIGVVLITNDPIQFTAHNQRMPSDHEPWAVGDPRLYLPYGSNSSLRSTLHAEQAVIAKAARAGVKTEGASLYTTVYPCPDCINNIVTAGIKRCYFEKGYAALASEDILKINGIEVVRVV